MSADVLELLKYIDPASLDYQEWVNVGMALKHEGYSPDVWEDWSSSDPRHKVRECFKKWNSFQSEGVTGGTIYEYARRGGYVPPSAGTNPLDWNSVISDDGVIDQGWLEEREVEEPSDAAWQPVQELITYIQTLFQSTENVGYVVDVYENEDKLSPKRGNWDRTAGQLLEELRKCKGDIGKVIGDTNPQAGAWIRFNPLDGQGVKNDNVTDYRFALVESDTLALGRQNAILRELELPIAAMVYSGGKSIHAIVRIEAPDYPEYRKRVEYLYKVCEKNGLKVDTQNKNPSRLSRMPGIRRNGHKQFLMDINIGKKSWDEWYDWIEGVNDDLPEPEDLADVWDALPPLADSLINGILRKGHKMLLAGPSKAGKSFALIELAIAIAEGRTWLGFQCAQGRVMYVNLELDRASCLHRFKDVYQALGWLPQSIGNIDIWNLRGKSVPMDKLAPKLIRRAEKKHYTAVIIDPIYKVITGDENSAEQMANFCNQFDKICTSLEAAVIYCHHHSKGAQGGKKSMDRASGSGVFARDPDALLDLTELELTDAIRREEEGKARIRAIERCLDNYRPGWRNDVSQDDTLSPTAMSEYASAKLDLNQASKMTEAIDAELRHCRMLTAWRIEATLREFSTPPPLNLWFDYPIHLSDDRDILKDIKVDDGSRRFKEAQKEQSEQTLNEYLDALSELFEDGVTEINITDLADLIGKSSDTIRKDFCGDKKSGKYRPRHKKALEQQGYKYVRGGKIVKLDTAKKGCPEGGPD